MDTVEHGEVPEGFQVLQEGLATIIYRHGESFYNNVQVVNRDISVMMLRFYDDYRREQIEKLAEGTVPSCVKMITVKDDQGITVSLYFTVPKASWHMNSLGWFLNTDIGRSDPHRVIRVLVNCESAPYCQVVKSAPSSSAMVVVKLPATQNLEGFGCSKASLRQAYGRSVSPRRCLILSGDDSSGDDSTFYILNASRN